MPGILQPSEGGGVAGGLKGRAGRRQQAASERKPGAGSPRACGLRLVCALSDKGNH